MNVNLSNGGADAFNAENASKARERNAVPIENFTRLCALGGDSQNGEVSATPWL
jgi:hypothetical protein